MRFGSFSQVFVIASVISGLSAPVTALAHPAKPLVPTASVPAQFEPYKFLIGAWDFGPEGKEAAGVITYRWGINQSYMWYTAQAKNAQGKLEPHFEGIIVWNGVTQKLDTLVALDLQAGTMQEQGTFGVMPDGSIVRDITVAIAATKDKPARTARFRNVYKPEGPARIRLSMQREEKGEWVAVSPDSETFVLTPRK